MRHNSFTLDHIRIERRALGPAKPFIIGLPLPVSADAMYATMPGRKPIPSQSYAAWLESAALRLAAVPAPRFKGAVWIAITVADGADFDNRARPILNLLMREGVIESRACVKALRLARGDVAGARVEIRPSAFEAM